MATTDRYDRYQCDAPETTARMELGCRVLHWLFMENLDGPGSSLGRRVVAGHAAHALALRVRA